MTRARAKKKGIHPLAAGALLAAGLGVFAASMLGGGGGGAPTAGGAFVPVDPAGEREPDATGEDAAPVHGDLLAVHGSYVRGQPVRHAFAFAVDAASPGPAAAPGGEMQRPAGNLPWFGADPPKLRVSVLMVTGDARRAVVDGAVVGLGDTVAAGRVVAIERGGLVVRRGEQSLTYDLESEHPREFRGELQRRAAAAASGAALPGGGARTDLQEEGK